MRTVRVEKRINEVVNRLNKTKVERKPDLKGEISCSLYYDIAIFFQVVFNMTF